MKVRHLLYAAAVTQGVVCIINRTVFGDTLPKRTPAPPAGSSGGLLERPATLRDRWPAAQRGRVA